MQTWFQRRFAVAVKINAGNFGIDSELVYAYLWVTLGKRRANCARVSENGLERQA